MKSKVILLSVLLALGCGQAISQNRDAKVLIQENPDRAACNMHSYEFLPVNDTPAPTGYAPFYISHYGRHGSRHDLSSSVMDKAADYLKRADSLNLLTGSGRELLHVLEVLSEEHHGMGGELSPRGGREHQMLAERMASRFPEVFASSDRQEVNAVSSTVQRCIVSMGNFVSSLKGIFPSINLHLTTGERYAPVIRLTGQKKGEQQQVGNDGPGSGGNRLQGNAGPRNGQGGQAGRGGKSGKGRQQEPLQGDFTAFLSKVFTSPGQLSGSKDDFIRSVYKAGGLCQDLDFLQVDIFKTFFTTDELYSLWKEENNSLYARWGNSVENGYRTAQSAKPLLKDIFEKADAALSENSKTAADLRFGHDIAYMALASLMGFDADGGERYHQADAWQHWYSFEIVPTAANIQFIFYKNSDNDILVKVLRNEQEIRLPGLTPVSGPYHRWSDVKAHYTEPESYSLSFDRSNYITLRQRIQTPDGDVNVDYRAYMHIPYVAKPIDRNYQSLCIFEPININGKPVNTKEAPILFSNRVGGYMPVDDSRTTDVGGRAGGNREALALAAGMVVVVPGCRGRTVKNEAGEYIGKAPAVIVDLKAAVRYLRHNNGRIPGNTERIISMGCSAGGAISAVLGASGNSRQFDAYLKELGAADERDDFFATGAFSPIMDIQHADMAYEWEFGETPVKGQLVDQALSKELRKEFAVYEQSLKLKGKAGFGTLTADNLGDYIAKYWLNPSATNYLTSLTDYQRKEYLADKAWMKWDEKTTAFSMKEYNTHFVGRYKPLPAYDAFDLSTPENGLFGSKTEDARHMTEFSLRHTSGNPVATIDHDLQHVIDLMNPMYHVMTNSKGCSPHWWIRHGTTESGISRAMMVNLSTALENRGKSVNSKLYWEAMHCVDMNPEGFIEWINSITR